MKKLLLITAIAAMSATTFAETDAFNFTEIDADVNGMISPEEASFYEGLSMLFSVIDSDTDGYLSKDEFTALDADQDGLLSIDEISM